MVVEARDICIYSQFFMEIIKKNARNFVSAVRAKVDGLLDVRVIALVMCARFENLLNVVCVTGA